jgi:hypothetical protein
MREKILAALKKLGPSAPGAIAKEISEKPEHVGYHMRAMAVAKALKAGGAGRARHYALPDQDLAGHRAPPSRDRRRASRPPSRAPRYRPLPRGPPSASSRSSTRRSAWYIINSGEPLSFNEAQTLAIADAALRSLRGLT